MKTKTIQCMALALFIVLISPTINADGHLSSEVIGNYEYGEKIAKRLTEEGALGVMQ